MNEPLKNEPNMHEPSDYLNRKVGDELTFDEAQEFQDAGGTFGVRYFVSSLPPAPAPTAEELLDGAIVNIDNLLRLCETIPSAIFGYNTYWTAKTWREKVRKLREV